MAIHAPVVLSEQAVGTVALSDGTGETLPVGHVLRKSQQEVRFRITRVLPTKTNLARCLVVAGGGDIVVAVAEELDTELNGVCAPGEDCRVGELGARLMENLRGIGGAEGEWAILAAAHRSAGEVQTGQERGRLAENQSRAWVRRPCTLRGRFRGIVIDAEPELVGH